MTRAMCPTIVVIRPNIIERAWSTDLNIVAWPLEIVSESLWCASKFAPHTAGVKITNDRSWVYRLSLFLHIQVNVVLKSGAKHNSSAAHDYSTTGGVFKYCVWITFLGLNASHRTANSGQETSLSFGLWNQRLRLSSAYRHHPQKQEDYRCQCLSDTAWNHLKVLGNIGLRISIIVHQNQLWRVVALFTHYFLSPFPNLKEGS